MRRRACRRRFSGGSGGRSPPWKGAMSYWLPDAFTRTVSKKEEPGRSLRPNQSKRQKSERPRSKVGYAGSQIRGGPLLRGSRTFRQSRAGSPHMPQVASPLKTAKTSCARKT
eukprot:5478997-Alexandrium_andersonii.AAC.1